MSDATLRMVLLGEDRSMSKAVKGAGSTADDAGKKWGALAKTAVLGFAGMGGAAVVMGVKAAAMNEQAQVAFTTLLGSSKKAQAYLADLNKFAANTPFDLPGLIDSSRLLLGVGMNAKQVIPTLTAWGDAAGALGIQQDGFNRAMIAVSQSLSAGRINAGDMNQIVQAGIPIWKLMSEATGKTVPELRKLSSQGELLSKDVLPLLNKQMEKDYGGSMAKQSKTLNGLWSTLMDTFSQGMAQAIVPLIPMLKNGLAGATNAVAVVLPKVSAALSSVTNWLVKNKTAVIAAAVAIGALVAITRIHAMVLAVQAAGGLAKYIAQTRIVTAVTRVWAAVQWLMNAALNANPIGIVIVAIAALAAGVIWAYKNVGWFRTAVDTAFHAIGAIATWLWNHIYAPFIRFLINGFATVADWIGNMLDALSHIPGFGWAADAAAKLHGAANAARNLANNIHDIPDSKTVTVNLRAVYSGVTMSAANAVNAARSRAGRGYASGGMNIPAGMAWVGEQGPELMYVPGGSNIYSASQSAAMVGGGAGGDLLAQAHIYIGTEKIHTALLRFKRQRGGGSLGLA